MNEFEFAALDCIGRDGMNKCFCKKKNLFFIFICDSCRKSAVMLDRISLGRFLCLSGFLWLLYGLNGAWYGVRLGLFFFLVAL